MLRLWAVMSIVRGFDARDNNFVVEGGVVKSHLMDDGLFTVERANREICARFTVHLERTMEQRPDIGGVVLVRVGGAGWGNERNTMLHAVLAAHALNRTVCYDASHSRTFGFLDSVLVWNMSGPCAAMRQRERGVQSLESAPADKDIALRFPSSNSNPTSLQSELQRSLAAFYGTSYPDVLACASEALFRPGDAVRAYAAPYLYEIRRAGLSIGIHLRSTDRAMASYQGYKGHRALSIDLRVSRRGCMNELGLAHALNNSGVIACIRRASPAAENSIVAFVASDTQVDKDFWLSHLGHGVTSVIATEGHAVHTGRPANSTATEQAGARKMLVDFYALTETDFFISNCEYTVSKGKHTPGNTFAYSVHVHRSPRNADSEFLAPNFQCRIPISP